jgi:hypothetical protein
MTPEEKKKKKARSPFDPVITQRDYPVNTPIESRAGGKGALDTVKAPLFKRGSTRRVGGFVEAPGASPSTVPEAPNYFTKENAPTMGWQERIARNNQLDANYRAALGATSREGIATGTNRTSIIREGMGNITARDIASNRDEAYLKGAIARTRGALASRQLMEEGLDRRQTSRHEYLTGEQQSKFDFLEGESEKERLSRIQQIRERGAIDLVESGALDEPQQVRDYMRSDEFSPGGLGEVESFRKPPTRRYKYIAPTTKTRTDLKSGVVEPVTIDQGGVFDETSGNITREPIDDENILDKYFDNTTGAIKVPTDQIPRDELDILIKKLKERENAKK